MDNQSPLQTQFQEADQDADGKINQNEAHNLMKLLGNNIYSGSVLQAIRLVNYWDPNATHFTFNQFKQYFESYGTPAKHALWKYKYQILQSIHEFSAGQSGSAAPGTTPVDRPQSGDLQVRIGPAAQNYPNSLHCLLEKCPKDEVKPFLKVVFEQNSVQSAKMLEGLIKKLHKDVCELVNAEMPGCDEITNSVNIMSNVVGSRLSLFITTSNEMLTELSMLISQYIDRILNRKTEAKIEWKYCFSANIAEFVKQNSDYTLGEAVTRNSYMKLAWSACNFVQPLKQILKKNQVFSELKSDSVEMSCMILIALLHLEDCEVKLTFDNSEVTGNESELKNELFGALSDLQSFLKEELPLNLTEVIQAINNNFKVEAMVGDWKLELAANVQDLNKLFTEPLHKNQQ